MGAITEGFPRGTACRASWPKGSASACAFIGSGWPRQRPMSHWYAGVRRSCPTTTRWSACAVCAARSTTPPCGSSAPSTSRSASTSTARDVGAALRDPRIRCRVGPRVITVRQVLGLVPASLLAMVLVHGGGCARRRHDVVRQHADRPARLSRRGLELRRARADHARRPGDSTRATMTPDQNNDDRSASRTCATSASTSSRRTRVASTGGVTSSTRPRSRRATFRCWSTRGERARCAPGRAWRPARGRLELRRRDRTRGHADPGRARTPRSHDHAQARASPLSGAFLGDARLEDQRLDREVRIDVVVAEEGHHPALGEPLDAGDDVVAIVSWKYLRISRTWSTLPLSASMRSRFVSVSRSTTVMRYSCM
jgi:hypothetical protein